MKLRTHGSCTGPQRIQVCNDRGLVSRTLHLPGKHPAPHRWLKNTPPRWEGRWHGTTRGHSAPLTGSQRPAPSRAIPSGQGRGGLSGWTLALGLRRGNRRPQEGRQEGSLDYVLLSSQVGIRSGYSRIVHSWSFCLQPGQHWSSAEGLWGREGSAGGQTDWLRGWITVSG